MFLIFLSILLLAHICNLLNPTELLIYTITVSHGGRKLRLGKNAERRKARQRRVKTAVALVISILAELLFVSKLTVSLPLCAYTHAEVYTLQTLLKRLQALPALSEFQMMSTTPRKMRIVSHGQPS